MVDDYFIKQAALCSTQDETPTELYEKYDVKKGLRDKDGKGVGAQLQNCA